jgi:hypothetical protein
VSIHVLPASAKRKQTDKIIDVSNPESYEDLVELLVPVLQKRGLMWDDYTVPGGTYRENLLGTPGQPFTPKGHPSTQFRYDVLKEKYATENGDIVINRQDPVEKVEEKAEETAPVAPQPPIVEASA